MAIESRQQSHFAGLQYEPLRYPAAPQFTNPWISASSSSIAAQPYPTSLPLNQPSLEQHAPSTNNVSMPYQPLPPTLQPLRTGTDLAGEMYRQANLLGPTSDLTSAPRPYGQDYTSSAPQASAYAPTVAPQYGIEYSQSRGYQYQDSIRRLSHPSVPPVTFLGSASKSRGTDRTLQLTILECHPNKHNGTASARRLMQAGACSP